MWRSMIECRGRMWTPSRGRWRSFFSFFFLRLSYNFRFAFLVLKVASQAFTCKISICSAKVNHVLRCSLSGELATGRARLRTAVRGAASQLQLTEPTEQRVAQRGLCAQAQLKVWAEKFAWARNPTRYVKVSNVAVMCFCWKTLDCVWRCQRTHAQCSDKCWVV